jgi:hypothetical protein
MDGQLLLKWIDARMAKNSLKDRKKKITEQKVHERNKDSEQKEDSPERKPLEKPRDQSQMQIIMKQRSGSVQKQQKSENREQAPASDF